MTPDDEQLAVSLGDRFSVEWRTDLECWAVRIENGAWVEAPRWLICDLTGGDRARYIDALIGALVELREKGDGHGLVTAAV